MTSEKQIEANSLATRSPSPALRGRGLGRGCLPPKSVRTNPNIPRQSAKSPQTRTHSKPNPNPFISPRDPLKVW
jgi:hypothetical protein